MTATQQWIKILSDLLGVNSPASPRGHRTSEILNYHSVVDMNFPIVVSPARKLSYKFMCREAYWIITADDRVETIAPWAPPIANFSDDGERFFGAYGPRIKDQLDGVVNKLCSDLDTRQAVMTIWRQNPPETKDVPCTVSVQWFIRDGKLHCVDTMRSSDAWLGWPYDVFNFSMLSIAVALRLHDRGIVVDLGDLHLNAGSQHLYEKNQRGARLCLDSHLPNQSSPHVDWSGLAHVENLVAYLEAGSYGNLDWQNG